MNKKFIFWKNIFYAYLKRGVPLTAYWGTEKIQIGFRNRGLLDYENLKQYEPCLQEMIKNIDSQFIFIDVGANIGLMSRIAVQNKYCIECISVEPSDSSFYILKNTDSQVNLISGALNDYKKNLKLKKEKNAARDFMISDQTSNSIKIVTSREIIEQLNNRADLFLKLDIEGGETDIDWEFWFSETATRWAAIEVWDCTLLENLKSHAESHGFRSKIFDARFEHEIYEFQEPCNLVMDRIVSISL